VRRQPVEGAPGGPDRRSARAARGIAAAVLAVLALAAAAAAAPMVGAGAPASGFEHAAHAAQVAAAGGAAIACAACHPARGGVLVGRPGHAACFGACHGAAPGPLAPGPRPAIPPDRERVCLACHAAAVLHAPAAPRAAFAVAGPAAAPDHALAIGHRAHRAIPCGQCHAAARAAPHRRCAACHDGTARVGRGPAMAECARCHVPAAAAAAVAPPAAAVRVTSAFSHARHAARGAAGRACATCHAAIVDTDAIPAPRPAAETCAAAACHDGRAAFPITAACTRCHRDPPAGAFEVARPAARFSHAAHGALGGGPLPELCVACHPLAPSGEVRVAGHAACAACHAADFGLRRPRICGACHSASEPWRPLIPDQLPPASTELGVELDHGEHAGACEACHSLTTATAQLRPPRGHRACTGAGCHAVSGGPAPALITCAGCHAPGRAAARRASRLAAPWSVRAAFDHASHQRAAGGALPCAPCHTGLGGHGLATLPTPAKATCVACHDGRAAFKVTGTGCARCHRGAGGGGLATGAEAAGR
jgi:c(7)-type cytochrome triheme protein